IVGGIKKNWWFLRFPENSDITTVADTFNYNLDSMSGIVLGFIKKIRYRLVEGSEDNTDPITFKTEDEFDDLIRDNNRVADDSVSCYTIRPADTSSTNGYIDVYPTPETTGAGTFYIQGFKKMDRLSSDTDETLIPIPSILENYAIAQIERIRGNDKKADYYEGLFYGPPPRAKDRSNLTGIALLEQLQEKSRPTSQPRSFISFRGHGAHNSLYSRVRDDTEEDDE
ncbi:hypothetical protein M0R04_16470, partial [Candidatus Dojkabacteria bacterium]|nr:hypothetical protein [Candidatus Dojkabacteria bacterium]